MAAENSSIEPRGDGVERILARAQGLCYATFTLVQDVLHLIPPAAPAATPTLQLVLGGVHQPLASFFSGKRRKTHSQANPHAQPRQQRKAAAAFRHPRLPTSSVVETRN